MGSQIKYIQKYTNARKQTPNIKMKNQQKNVYQFCVSLFELEGK